MKNQLLVYGANGYTGRLIVETALREGIKPVIAGRNEEVIKKMASEFALEYKAFGLNDKSKVADVLKDFSVVIHAAGPFIHTAKTMVEACIAAKTHYLDITGEIEVFELCKAYNKPAQEAGVMVMPGSGFDVVPSDCLAAHLKARLPGAQKLQLAFTALGGGLSRGTAKTVVENLGRGGAVRENHKIITVPTAHKTMTVDFGDFKFYTMCIPWGDVSTAYHSTGIPNIEVYTGVPERQAKLMKLSNLFNSLLKTKWVKDFLRKKIDARPPGPSEKKRIKSKSYLWGRVEDAAGNSKTALLKTHEGYTLTALTSIAIAKKILAGNFKPGYQTPSSAYGADLILEIPGTERQDVI